ncbi:TrbC/VirB2 family protein [Parasutterella sp.]|jgi:type IV secretion system protein VirB2|uniref:TrbC/VirB2 family protein n=1 Tax=Parasutterella sp. TaxID=2049037 RepID=UPI003521955B
MKVKDARDWTKALILSFLIVGCQAAFAASGASATVESFFSEIMTVMKTCCVTVASCAGLWIGYKVLWGGRTLEEMAPFIIGCLILACAPWAAETLLQ